MIDIKGESDRFEGRGIDQNGYYRAFPADSEVMLIAFGIVIKPGIFHELVRDHGEEGPICNDERYRIALRLFKTLHFFTKCAGDRGVQLYTALRIMVQHVPDSIDPETAFMIACSANDVGAAYNVLVEHRRLSFMDSGNANSLFARALRALPEDCAERTYPQSWYWFLPKPYRLAVQLAAEQWDPVKEGEAFAKAFLTLQRRVRHPFRPLSPSPT